MRLGAPFKMVDDASAVPARGGQRIAAINAAVGVPVDASVAGG